MTGWCTVQRQPRGWITAFTGDLSEEVATKRRHWLPPEPRRWETTGTHAFGRVLRGLDRLD